MKSVSVFFLVQIVIGTSALATVVEVARDSTVYTGDKPYGMAHKGLRLPVYEQDNQANKLYFTANVGGSEMVLSIPLDAVVPVWAESQAPPDVSVFSTPAPTATPPPQSQPVAPSFKIESPAFDSINLGGILAILLVAIFGILVVRGDSSTMTCQQGRAVILALVILVGTWPFSYLKPITQWEYQVVHPSDALFESEMNALGRKGWEMVSARRATSGLSASYEMICKRQSR